MCFFYIKLETIGNPSVTWKKNQATKTKWKENDRIKIGASIKFVEIV